jgi:hypothetical protein
MAPDTFSAEARAIAANAARLGSPAQEIQTAANKFRARRHARARAFAALGDAIINYARQQNAGLGHAVTAADCPMARKYWLQRGEKVQNPFYGKAMSECGRMVSALPDLNR